MLLPNPFTHDSRVEREARTLVAMGHEVMVSCVYAPGLPDRETKSGVLVVRTPRPGWLGWRGPMRLVPLLRHFSWYEFLARVAESWRPHVVHSHDLETLLPAARLAALLRVLHVHDDHELGLEKLGQGTETLLSGWRKLMVDAMVAYLRRRGSAIEGHLIPKAAAVFAGSPMYARVLQERYGRTVIPLLNVPWKSDLPADPRLRADAGLPPDARVALYQGTVTPGGGGQQCVLAARRFPEGWYLVFLGITWMRERLESLARAEGLSNRVRFLDPVPPAELPGWTRAADLGLAPIRPVNIGQAYSLANKVFEYLHGGLPIVSSDIPAQGALVRELNAGVVLADVTPDSIAEAVGRIAARTKDEVQATSARLRAVARERFCWEVESRILMEAYGRILAAV
jgi:glycosyltransferase involved in cell wall biosynthesis